MKYFRHIFLIILITGSTSIGFLLSKRYKDRVKELKEISNLVNIIQNKIKFTHMPLVDILEDVSKINVDSRISKVFFKISQKLKNKPTSIAFEEALDEERFFFSLKDDDISLVKNLGNTLGKTDIDGQMSGIEEFKAMLETNINIAEQERMKNEKMYKSLGTIIGLAIAIILY